MPDKARRRTRRAVLSLHDMVAPDTKSRPNDQDQGGMAIGDPGLAWLAVAPGSKERNDGAPADCAFLHARTPCRHARQIRSPPPSES